MEPLNKKRVEYVSQKLFEYSLVNQKFQEKLAVHLNIPINDVNRLSSENLFVQENSLLVLENWIKKFEAENLEVNYEKKYRATFNK